VPAAYLVTPSDVPLSSGEPGQPCLQSSGRRAGFVVPIDRQFDFIFLGSVFTHMLPDDVEQYLREISRLLAPGGVCVASYFLITDDNRAGIDNGRSFMSFGVPHASGVCLLHDAAVPESAVAFDEAFVCRAHAQAGLRIRDIRRGQWWNGVAHDQDVVTAVAASA
jgi:SAM-dependent methyltransferase